MPDRKGGLVLDTGVNAPQSPPSEVAILRPDKSTATQFRTVAQLIPDRVANSLVLDVAG
jgi:hypothetical protein